AQITRGDAEALGLQEGDTVYVRATRVPPIADDPLARSEVGPEADMDEGSLTSA
ncbi:MAG: sulfate/molybdate ABC transporter ATP-binding protein, partial [Mycobacterium sp.]